MPHLIFGAGSIGTTATSFTYTWDTPAKVAALLTELRRLGLCTLDSAASYPPGNAWNTETLLGQAACLSGDSFRLMPFIIDTKVLVRAGEPFLSDALVDASISHSLALLRVSRVRTLYAHANDGITPLAGQAAALDRQVRLGRCAQYGLSNYAPADVASFFDICEEHKYIKPAVVQGMYNALRREAEDELLPLLRRHGCAFYAYSPLAGGFLTGKVTAAKDRQDGAGRRGEGPPGELLRTRWHGASAFPPYLKIYDTPAMHAAVRRLQAVCAAADPPMTTQEAAMRWLLHHSALTDTDDGVIFGAKTVEQIRTNVAEMRRGPLPEAVREVVDGLWATTRKPKTAAKNSKASL
ncbi:hypothetical protein SPBR_01865 [Sporothrix brasiliensis 5110]|uniref:NADP-dependent oxidoreductase domain-containing protein n=1 Tax=Sporothrix brasiliensis 5110 TaxID=1398154 RepID=A0A0C2J1T1_9PEZI|nr:uncharacterized protein SPBR_01865 [Sporothrix brasiliensis 5110]KIH91057.1 hypothetical protein SPBR_01865 [Sporothrix brasiliensis 5110]